MISYIISFFNYFFSKNEVSEDDTEKEDYLAEKLLDLEIIAKNEQNLNKYDDEYSNDAVEIPRTASCLQRTGVITFIDGNNVCIDGLHYFDKSACSIPINVKEKILYLGYKNVKDILVVVRILQNLGCIWEDEDVQVEETNFKVLNHVIVGEVKYRDERYVFMNESDLKFSLDEVEGSMIPVRGDWLELLCIVQLNEDKPMDLTAAQVVKVISFRPLRSKVKSASISDWNGEQGTCDRQLYFDTQCLPIGFKPTIGSKVLVEAIESNQGICAWRVIKLVPTTHYVVENPKIYIDDIELQSLKLEKYNNIEATHPLKFDNVRFNETAEIEFTITNKSKDVQFINKTMVLSKKRDSQINITPVISSSIRMRPDQSYTFNITCKPKFYGNTKEPILIFMKGIKIERIIEINVVGDDANITQLNNRYGNKSESEKIMLLKNIRNNKNNETCVPGERPIKPPNFIPVRLGSFVVPDRVWAVILGDSKQVINTVDYNKIISNIEERFPCLIKNLSINNYQDKWHTLLYMEEVQANIDIRVFDMSKVFLIRCQEYLSLEINNLSERRPSLVVGDKVIVKDIWDNNAPKYVGYIHAVKGNFILIKFNRSFQETYSGSDVSVEFHFSRTRYRRAHNAINLALSNLGPDILFPSRVSYQPSRIPIEKLDLIQWHNKNLNECQKTAVTNILSGECRPKPYCIYGPPGTGKTVTVIETILQILKFYPDSRILVATPSNSAANLITQRLLEYRDNISNSLVRILANYLCDSDTIPSNIKTYCATIDIAIEGTCKPIQSMHNGINMNCPKSFIGRHRVTIGTCYCLGSLIQMGFPKGHFTHIIVDEAGQATEPEIMIPLTFTDNVNGQIILAGDPMQLGPIVMSRYCQEFGMDESYLCRLLETFPYQKDYVAFKNGFNNKLVTKLVDNYRSLEEVIKLPSELFYDGSLVPRINPNQKWIEDILETISDVFPTENAKREGVYVYGIRGTNTRAEDNPSWYNPQEASMVALTTCKLYKKNIATDDIGIITPYIAQIKYIRTLFDAMGLPQPKIGTVEEFQGQERPLIIISTVRSSELLVSEDIRNALGFVRNSKRINVALTRAQVAVLLFCNPNLLYKDPLWYKVIEYAVKQDKYVGCDLPQEFCNTTH